MKIKSHKHKIISPFPPLGSFIPLSAFYLNFETFWKH